MREREEEHLNEMPQGEIRTNIYAFIVAFLQREGIPPTIREIGRALGISSTGHVSYHLDALERLGLITRSPGKNRSIKLAQPSGIPVIGSIAAGAPLDIFPDAFERREFLEIERGLCPTETFALCVRGWSMVDDSICDGDYVVCKPQSHYRNGEIVVATYTQGGINGSATLKRFFREEGQIRLQPANTGMQPLCVSLEEWDREWTVQGKVIAIFRRYDRDAHRIRT